MEDNLAVAETQEDIKKAIEQEKENMKEEKFNSRRFSEYMIKHWEKRLKKFDVNRKDKIVYTEFTSIQQGEKETFSLKDITQSYIKHILEE